MTTKKKPQPITGENTTPTSFTELEGKSDDHPLGKTVLSKSDSIIPKQSYKDLKDSEVRYRRLFETAKDGILILDGDTGRIVDANPFLQDMLGYSESELIGKALWEIGPVVNIAASQDASGNYKIMSTSVMKTSLWRLKRACINRWSSSAMFIWPMAFG